MNELHELAELAAGKLHRFRRQIKECSKCGWGPRPVPGLIVRWLNLTHTAFKVWYCIGGHAPEQQFVLETPLGRSEHQVQVLCAGISHNHLHVVCLHCGFQFLMEPKDGG